MIEWFTNRSGDAIYRRDSESFKPWREWWLQDHGVRIVDLFNSSIFERNLIRLDEAEARRIITKWRMQA